MAQHVIDLEGGGVGALQKDITSATNALAGLERQTRGLASALSGLFSSFSLDKAMAQAEKTVKRTTTTVRKQARKALLSFDEIQRISTENTTTTTTVTVTEKAAADAGAASALLEAILKTVLQDLAAIRISAEGLFSRFSGQLLLLKWLETAAKTVTGEVQRVFSETGGFFQEFFAVLGSLAQETFAGMTAFLGSVFSKEWSEIFGVSGGTLEAFFANAANGIAGLKDIFSGIVSFLKGTFTGDWSGAWSGIVGIFKGLFGTLTAAAKAPVNGVIGLVNGLIGGVISGINLVIRGLNAISFSVPDWVPVLGGKNFGLHLGTLTAPRIPYLAQGAVLPANKPFMAVVGDQKNGTNVEAPLDTIKEALMEVMSSQPERQIVLNFTGDLAQLGRVLRPVIAAEDRRVGTSLVRKGAL